MNGNEISQAQENRMNVLLATQAMMMYILVNRKIKRNTRYIFGVALKKFLLRN